MALFDLVRPQWKHSDFAKRAEAMRLLEDDRQDLFVPAAMDDSHADVRAAAAKRLQGEANLRKVLDKTGDGAVREVVQKALIKIIAERARTARHPAAAEARAWADELRNMTGNAAAEKALEDIVLNAAALETRKAALTGLAHASSFLAVALKEENAALALEAFARLNREAQFEAVAKSAKSKEARQAAKETLRDLQNAKKPDAAMLNRAKLSILVSTVEKVEAGVMNPGNAFDWEAAREQVDAAEFALNELLSGGTPVPDAVRTAFRTCVTAVRARISTHEATETARRARDAEERRVRGIREEISARMEAIFADPKPADEAEVEELSRRFRATGNASAGREPGGSGESDPLAERFRIARDRLVKDKLRKQRDAEDAARREQQEAHAARRLSDLAAEAESLNASKRETTHPGEFAARTEALAQEWTAAHAQSSSPESSQEKAALEARFNTALSGLHAKLETARTEAVGALEKTIADLEALTNALDQKTDMKAVEKRLRDLQARGKALLAFLGESGHGAALRYHAAADHLRETLDWSRWANLQRKQSIITRLEALLPPAAPGSEATETAPAREGVKNAENAGNISGTESAEAAPSFENSDGIVIGGSTEVPAAADLAASPSPGRPAAAAEIPERSAPASSAASSLSPAETRAAFTRFKELLAEWKSVGPVPWDATEATWDRYHRASDALYETFREYFAELDGEREGNLKAKEEICARLESLMAAPDVEWRDVNEAFREAHSAWKAAGAVPREKSDALWDRFRAVNKAFHDKRDGSLHENLAAKRELLARVEALKDSTEWKNAAARIKEAQEQWKTIGAVPREKSESLWNRFHGACEAFFAARRAHFDLLDAERPLNLEKKTALCELVEKLEELPGDRERYERILEAQAQWKEIGPVPREQEDALWDRFRAPLDAYFAAHRERSAAERGLREEGAKAKEELCAEAEALTDSTDWKTTIAKIKELQARWKASPPAPRNLDQALWQRFRAACDAFFTRLKANDGARDGDREGNLRAKEDLCFAVEIMSGLPAGDADKTMARDAWVEAQLAAGHGAPEAPVVPGDWGRAADKVKGLQQEWRRIGPVPREDNDAVWNRFQRACDAFFDEQRRALGRPDEDPQHNLEEKLALIADAEELGRNPGPKNRDAVETLRRKWKRIGPVPRAQTDYVWERFETAGNAALGEEREKGSLFGSLG